ncbi:MAG: hypothetical protein WD872_20880 [Pirellulaceae bacterium]
MPTNHDILEALDDLGRGLRLSFVWWADRYGHLISVVGPNGEAATVLSSIEGISDGGWPLSPPLQSLSIEYLAGGRHAALLVGMAGRSHWSASVEAVPDRAELLFDVACRLGQTPAKLSSRYSVSAGEIVSARGDKERSVVEVRAEGRLLRIHREPIPGVDVVLRLPAGDIVIRPKLPEKLASATVRWKYRVELVGSPV